MKKGDWVHTPRFGKVKIEKVFQKYETATKVGFTEPTYYRDDTYDVCGKALDGCHMIFAAVKKIIYSSRNGPWPVIRNCPA